MYTQKRAIFFKALSGIHTGSGADLGIVDLPIQRERHTGFPKIESSGIKGCLREEFEHTGGLDSDFVKVAFGPEEENGKDTKHSGAVAFTDARILLFPVRSARGVFAYATCPLVLSRLYKDFQMAEISDIESFSYLDSFEVSEKAFVTGNTLKVPNSDKVVLEEYTYTVEVSDKAVALANRIATWLGTPKDEYLLNNLIVLPNDEFTDFVQNATEIITRIKIDEKTGTVAKGALFTEELLPTETVLYSLAMSSSIFLPESERNDSKTLKKAEDSGNVAKYLLDIITDKLSGKYLQIGGDATIGKGLVSVSVVGEGK